ncbi:MAG: hypothetical protein QW228_06775 [Candidatus Aenigmatarchaeota archaeon]
MLAEVTINNQEVTVYKVPQGKKAMIEIIVNPIGFVNIWVKINDKVIIDEVVDKQIGQKLILFAQDEVKVGTDGTVNVFISGMEV